MKSGTRILLMILALAVVTVLEVATGARSAEGSVLLTLIMVGACAAAFPAMRAYARKRDQRAEPQDPAEDDTPKAP